MDRVDIKSQWRTPYAFIVFADAAAAEEAVKGENRRNLSGYTLRVEIATGVSARSGSDRRDDRLPRSGYRLEVRHLPYHCSWQVCIEIAA